MKNQYKFTLNNQHLEVFDDIIYGIIYQYSKQDYWSESCIIPKDIFKGICENRLKEEYKVLDIDDLHDITEPCIMVEVTSYTKQNRNIVTDIMVRTFNIDDFSGSLVLNDDVDEDEYDEYCVRFSRQVMPGVSSPKIDDLIELHKNTSATLGIMDKDEYGVLTTYPAEHIIYGPFSIKFKDKLFSVKDEQNS